MSDCLGPVWPRESLGQARAGAGQEVENRTKDSAGRPSQLSEPVKFAQSDARYSLWGEQVLRRAVRVTIEVGENR